MSEERSKNFEASDFDEAQDEHPRNLYGRFKPDYDFLAQVYPDFKKDVGSHHWKRRAGGVYVDWNDPVAVKAVSVVLAKHDFGLELDLPLNHLCPPLPRSLNYLHWIAADLLRIESPLPLPAWPPKPGDLCWALLPEQGWLQVLVCEAPQAEQPSAEGSGEPQKQPPGVWVRPESNPESSPEFVLLSDSRPVAPYAAGLPAASPIRGAEAAAEVKEIKGLDIGTGASCVFPLLGSRCYPQLRWTATELDPESVEAAEGNVRRNGLESRIQVIQVPERAKMLLGIVPFAEEPGSSPPGPGHQFEFRFSMCNPPFFSSVEQAGHNRKRKTMATPQELCCPGGELQFVGQMIRESFQCARSVQWFTTMLGRKASLVQLRELLRTQGRQRGITAIRETEFRQGRQTRWGLAWSFDPDMREMAEAKPAPKHSWQLELRAAEAHALLEHLRGSLESRLKEAGFSASLTQDHAFRVSVRAASESLAYSFRLELLQRSPSQTVVQFDLNPKDSRAAVVPFSELAQALKEESVSWEPPQRE